MKATELLQVAEDLERRAAAGVRIERATRRAWSAGRENEVQEDLAVLSSSNATTARFAEEFGLRLTSGYNDYLWDLVEGWRAKAGTPIVNLNG